MAQRRSLDLNKIIDQANKLICEKGLSETTLPAIAKSMLDHNPCITMFLGENNYYHLLVQDRLKFCVIS